MSFLDWVAVIGALAWLPPIISLVKGWLTKAELRIITQPAPEIGFTAYGPICNLRLAFSVRNKELIVTGVKVKITHESGEEHVFEWRGLTQKMGQFNYPQIGQVPFEKESDVLAIKMVPNTIEERFIRFQETAFNKGRASLAQVVLKKISYLKQQGPVDYAKFLKSQEMNDVYSFIRQSFFWKPGTYNLKFLIESPEAFKTIDDEYSFSLSPSDVTHLEENRSQIERSYFNELAPPSENEKREPVTWNWSYPDMQKKS